LILNILVLGWGLTDTVHAAADVRTTALRLQYISNIDEISSGGFIFDQEKQKAGYLFFPFVYDFETNSTLNPYVGGSIGYGTADYSTLKMLYIGTRIDSGINFAPNKDMNMRLGGSYQMTYFGAPDQVGGSGYTLDASYRYHPDFGEWQPYILGRIRYGRNQLDINTKSQKYSFGIGKIKVGIITPVLAHLARLPIRVELYGAEIIIRGDMARILDTRYMDVAGAKLYLGSPILQQWISDITIGIQLIHGEHLKGASVGLGIKF